MNIFVLGKADIPDFDEKLNIPANDKTFILSITDPSDSPPRCPVNVPAGNRKVIYFHDTTDEIATAPQKHHIEDIIYWFNQIKDEAENLIVHCFAGISRSTATTFIFHCLLLGAGQEKEALTALLKSAIFGGARPNSRIVRLADEILDRRGNMINVIYKYYEELEICRKAGIRFGSIDHLF